MVNYVDDLSTLNKKIESLKLAISTVDAHDAGSHDLLFVNIVFSDGTRLYDPYNFPLLANGFPISPLPPRGNEALLPLNVPPELDRKLVDISEVFIRKEGSNGWFVGKVVLFANEKPLIGNSQANQVLDNDDRVLRLADWSTGSFCVAPATDPKYPLLCSGYRLLGPVIGQMSDKTAIVLYRVDREGKYRFRAIDTTNGVTVHDETTTLSPTHLFKLTGLHDSRRYDFDLKFVRGGIESVVPGAAGSLTTYPQEGSHGAFTFAFGSCANPAEQAAQGSWTAIRSLAMTPGQDKSPVRLFIHLGDTFYFYDHMIEETPHNVESMHAAHVSMRRHIEFLDMAREVPCCGIWDDHDFAGDDTDSTVIEDENLRKKAVDTWRQYWGNQPIDRERDNLGLTTRISYGSVDVYLLDGRYYRNFGNGVFFGNEMISRILHEIDDRGSRPRVVVLGTGSNWTHNYHDKENYGDERYDDERENFFKELANRLGTKINGLLLLSGDNHVNEIFHVKLGNNRMAPEFSSSPFTLNSELEDEGRPIEGERVAGFPTGGSKGKRGFCTLTIRTLRETRENWTATVRYYQEAFAAPYASRTYITSNGQFNPI